MQSEEIVLIRGKVTLGCPHCSQPMHIINGESPFRVALNPVTGITITPPFQCPSCNIRLRVMRGKAEKHGMGTASDLFAQRAHPGKAEGIAKATVATRPIERAAYNPDELDNLLRAELVELCKRRGLPSTGSKATLLERLKDAG